MQTNTQLFLALSVFCLSSNILIVDALPAKFLVPENTLSITEIKASKSKLNKKIKSTQRVINISHSPIGLGFVSSTFGMRKDPIDGLSRMHKGIDIAAQRGSLVKPIGSGEVIFSGYKSGFGNLIEIRHSKTVVSRYAHLKRFLVDVGEQVKISDTIGLVGNTGRSTGPHLHLEVLLNDRHVDPKVFLANKFYSRSKYYAKVHEEYENEKFANQFEGIVTTKTNVISKESIYVSADGLDVLTNVTQLEYKDYVESLSGMYGLFAPNAYQ